MQSSLASFAFFVERCQQPLEFHTWLSLLVGTGVLIAIVLSIGKQPRETDEPGTETTGHGDRSVIPLLVISTFIQGSRAEPHFLHSIDLAFNWPNCLPIVLQIWNLFGVLNQSQLKTGIVMVIRKCMNSPKKWCLRYPAFSRFVIWGGICCWSGKSGWNTDTSTVSPQCLRRGKSLPSRAEFVPIGTRSLAGSVPP